MESNDCFKKRKGGAEKTRDKNKQKLLLEAKSCKSIQSFLKSRNNENHDIVNEDETKDVEIGTSTLDKVIDSYINNVSFIQNDTVSIGNKDYANIGSITFESYDHQQFLSNEIIPNSQCNDGAIGFTKLLCSNFSEDQVVEIVL